MTQAKHGHDMCVVANSIELGLELMIAALAAHPVALERHERKAQGAKWSMTGLPYSVRSFTRAGGLLEV